MRDRTDFFLSMDSAHLKGWAYCAGGMDVLFGLLDFGKGGLEHLLDNKCSVLDVFHQPHRDLGVPAWTQWQESHLQAMTS